MLLLIHFQLGFAAERKNGFAKFSHFFAFRSLTKNSTIFAFSAKIHLNLFHEKIQNFKKCKTFAKIRQKDKKNFREKVCEMRTKIFEFLAIFRETFRSLQTLCTMWFKKQSNIACFKDVIRADSEIH